MEILHLDTLEKKALYTRLDTMSTSLTKLQTTVITGGTFITLIVAILGWWNNYSITKYDSAYNSVIRLEVQQALMQDALTTIQAIEHVDSRPLVNAVAQDTAKVMMTVEGNKETISSLERQNDALANQMRSALSLLNSISDDTRDLE